MLKVLEVSDKLCEWYIACVNQTVIITGFHSL